MQRAAPQLRDLAPHRKRAVHCNLASRLLASAKLVIHTGPVVRHNHVTAAARADVRMHMCCHCCSTTQEMRHVRICATWKVRSSGSGPRTRLAPRSSTASIWRPFVLLTVWAVCDYLHWLALPRGVHNCGQSWIALVPLVLATVYAASLR